MAVLASAAAKVPAERGAAAPRSVPPAITLPMEYADQHIFLVLSDEQSRPLTLLLDTGFEGSALSRAGAGNRQVFWAGTMKPTGYGGKPSKQWYGKADITLRSGRTKVFSGTVLVLDLDTLRGRIGHPMDGVLGWDFFSGWCTTLDFGARRLVLRESSACARPDGEQRKIQSEWLPNGLLLPSVITFTGGRQATAMLHMDTGCDTSLMLNEQFRDKAGIGTPGVAARPVEAWGVNGATMADKVSVSRLELDGGAMRIPATGETTAVIQRAGSLTRSNWWHSGFTQKRVDRDGLLGTEILERFTWTFDPEQKAVYIAARVETPDESAASRGR